MPPKNTNSNNRNLSIKALGSGKNVLNSSSYNDYEIRVPNPNPEIKDDPVRFIVTVKRQKNDKINASVQSSSIMTEKQQQKFNLGAMESLQTSQPLLSNTHNDI